jgi:hypothetical protein
MMTSPPCLLMQLMDASRKTFLSSWAAELQQRHPPAALPPSTRSTAHGALSGHLLSKDDTTVFGQSCLADTSDSATALIIICALD